MKENIKTLNDNLEVTKEIGELFSNKTFLEVLVNFLNNYSDILGEVENGEQDIKTINGFLDSILNEKGINEKVDVNDIYLFIYDYFSYGNRFHSFLGYINNQFLSEEEKESKIFSPIFKIMDYLYSKLPESANFSDDYVLEIFINQLKIKIEDILLDGFDNAMFELSVNNFSPYTENGNPIHKVNFENTYTFGKELYVFVEYYDTNGINKTGYINKNGKLKRSRKGIIVTSIEYAFSFGTNNFIKIIDEYNSREVELVSENNVNIEGIELKDIKIGKLKIGNNTLKYLIAIGEFVLDNGNTSNFSNILDKDLNHINISDLQYFMINGELPKKDTNKKVPDKLKYFDENNILSQINKVEYFDGINFLELTTLNARKKENLVLTNKGEILSDDEGFIININGIEEILDFKFLSYGKRHGFKEGFLDKNMNIVNLDLLRSEKVEKVKLFCIESNMEYKGEKYFIINNDKELILSKSELNNQLEKYSEFEGITGVFQLDLLENKVNIGGETYKFLKINKLNDGSYNFDFYDLSNNVKLQKVSGIDNFIKLFDSDEFPKQIIKEIEFLK